MKLLKILAAAIGVLLLLGIGAAVVASVVIDPNDYKPRIEQLAKEHTGRELSIAGDIELSLFPWLGLKLQKVSLGNAPGFSPASFAELDAMHVRVKLMPLLSREVEMDTVEISGLRLQLSRNAEGVTNWADLMATGQPRPDGTGGGNSETKAPQNPPKTAGPKAEAPSSTGSSATGSQSRASQSRASQSQGPASIALLGLGGIDIKDSAVTWQDATSGQVVKVSGLQAQTGAVSIGQPVEFSLAMEVAELAPGLGGHIEAKLTASADQAFEILRVSDVELVAKLQGQALSGGKAEIHGRATSGVFDTKAQRLNVTGLEVRTDDTVVGDLKANLSIRTSTVVDLAQQVVSLTDLVVEGQLDGQSIPGGRLPFKLSGNGQADLAQSTIGFGELQVSLPSVAAEGMTGRVDVTGSAAGQLDEQRFKLDLTEIAGRFKGKGLPDGKLDIDASTKVAVDLAAQVLELNELALQAADLTGNGQITVTDLLTEPRAAGRLELQKFNPRVLAALLGQALPATADPKALSSASLSTAFDASAKRLALSQLALGLDGSAIAGTVTVPDLTRQALEFDLTADKFDLDRYLPPAEKPKKKPAQKPAKKAAASPSDGKANAASKTEPGKPTAVTPATGAVATAGLPIDTLRALDLDGKLQIGQLKAMNMRLSKVGLGLRAKAGLIALTPISAGLYGGSYEGSMQLDARGETATIKIDEKLTNIAADQMLKALQLNPGVNLGGGRSNLHLKANASGDTATQTFLFEKVGIDADLAGKDFPTGRLKFALSTDAKLDLKADQLSADDFKAGFGGARLAGALKVSKLTTDPRYTATLSMPKFNPRKVLAALGQPPIVTADKKALGSAELTLEAAGSARSIKVDQLDFKLDQSRLTGKLAVADFDSPAIKFDLNLDAIDADRYLPPPNKPRKKSKKKNNKKKKQQAKKKAPAAKDSKKSSGGAASPGTAAALLPVELLRALNLDGQLKIGRLKINRLQMTKVVFKAKAKDGKVSVNPLNARLYKGTYAGQVRIDATGKRPKINFNEKLTGVQAGPIFKALSGKASITGKANFTAKGSAFGPDQRSLVKTLAANAEFKFEDGRFTGINLAELLCSGLGGLANGGKVDAGALLGALLDQAARKSSKNKAKSAAEGTRFADLTGTVQVKKGLASNQDLKMRSPLLRVGGKGKANLVTERVDYTAIASVVGSCEGQGATDSKLSGVDIPVRVTGTFSKLKYDPQFDGVISALAGGDRESSSGTSSSSDSSAAPKSTKPRDQLKDLLKGILKN